MKIVVAGNYRQFLFWLRENKLLERRDAIYVPDSDDAANVIRGINYSADDVVLYGTWDLRRNIGAQLDRIRANATP